MKRTIPKSLVQRQEKTRKDTVEMVTQAILVLESQGYNIKIKDLISVTGLSRSVFAKPHIREVLVEYGIIQTQTPEKTAGAESTRRRILLVVSPRIASAIIVGISAIARTLPKPEDIPITKRTGVHSITARNPR